MKSVIWIFPVCGLALLLSNCGGSSSTAAGPGVVTGPFDSNGAYREEWADDPSKWKRSGGSPSPHESRSDELPAIARNDQPPANSVPIVTARAPERKPEPIISTTSVTPRVVEVRPEPVVVKSTSVEKPKPKLKPKPKVVVKAKPKPVRYTVKKGDSLSSIANRTGASVSAIKSANGISGTLIRPGQSLTIPKK